MAKQERRSSDVLDRGSPAIDAAAFRQPCRQSLSPRRIEQLRFRQPNLACQVVKGSESQIDIRIGIGAGRRGHAPFLLPFLSLPFYFPSLPFPTCGYWICTWGYWIGIGWVGYFALLFTDVHMLMLGKGRYPAIFFTVHGVSLNEPGTGQSIEKRRKVHFVIWQHVELDGSGTPFESALPIGNRPKPSECQADRKAGFLLKIEQLFMGEEFRLY